MDFGQADEKFKQLKARYEAGELTEAEFKSQLQDLMVQDERGDWWMIGYETERWYRHDGTDWVQADPPEGPLEGSAAGMSLEEAGAAKMDAWQPASAPAPTTSPGPASQAPPATPPNVSGGDRPATKPKRRTGLFVASGLGLLAICVVGCFVLARISRNIFSSSAAEFATTLDASFTQAAMFTEAPTKIPTEAPTRVPAASGDILFQDDFSDLKSGWPSYSSSYSKGDYSGNGQYVIHITRAKLWDLEFPEWDFTDVRMEVDATKTSGPESNGFGLICRYQDIDNFYFFLVSSDGHQMIGKYEKGQFKGLSAEKMQPTDVLKAGNSTNHLRADCAGSTLTLYANGQQLSSVTDTSFMHGKMGLIAWAFDEPNLEVTFDNFVVYQP